VAVSGGRRAFRRFLATAVATSLALGSPTLISGCSIFFVRGVDKEAPGRYAPGNCTTSRAAPIVDTILTVPPAAALYSLTQLKDTGVVRDSVIVTDIALAVLFGVSAIYGYATVATCRQLRSQVVSPYQHGPVIQTRKQRQSEEADEEAAVQARLREKAAADAKAAGEAAARTRHPDGGAPTAP